MTIAVVSNDAGCSELLCALIERHNQDASWHLFAQPQSPMATICGKAHLDYIPITAAAAQLSSLRPDLLLFGTGWQERIERPFVRYCKEHHIPTVAFLDHWSNYRERFGYPEAGWEENLGDFSALSDPNALALAAEYALPSPLPLPNYYLLRMIEEASHIPYTPKNTLLFLSEPTDAVARRTYGDPMYWGFTQFSALEEILKHFDSFGCESLSLRLHPSDTGEGYDALLKRYPDISSSIHTAAEIDLSEHLLESKVVIGFDTMALYIAALLGKAVISYLPSPNRDFLLPLPPERQLRNLDQLDAGDIRPLHIRLDDFGMDFASFLKKVTDKD